MIWHQKLDRLEIAKVLIATIILTSIITIGYYQVQIGMRPQPPKLVIVTPGSLYVAEEVPLKIAVVNDKGAFIEGRNDLIELSILTKGNAMLGVSNNSEILWSNTVKIQLHNGIATVLFRGGDEQSVIIQAKQIQGESMLEETRTTFIPHFQPR